MAAHNEAGSTADLASSAGQDWLANSVFQVPELEISRVKSWASITAVSYHRGDGEAIWRSSQHRLGISPDPLPPQHVQVEQGPTRQLPAVAPGTLLFFPADLKVRVVFPAARLIQVLGDTDLYSALLPELAAAASGSEFLAPFQDPLLSQIVMTLAQENDGGFADRILIQSLGTAMCIRIAQRFVGRLPLPTSKGLSPERLQRVRDYVEAHLDEDLSLTVLADIACLSAYHFSRSFKQGRASGSIITSCNAGSNGQRL